MVVQTFPPASLQPQLSPAQPSLKVVAFAIAQQVLALPMESVVKVANCPPQLYRSTEALELLNIGHHVITVVNLYHHFTGKPSTANRGKFLIITQALQGEMYALRVDTPPDLLTIPHALIRTIPDSYRQGHPLRITSHVAVLPKKNKTVSLFLLSMKLAIAAIKRGK